MRRVLFFAFALIGITIGATSCSSTYDANPNDSGTRNPLQGEFRASVNGQQFIAEEKYLVDTTIAGSRTVSMTGYVYGPERDTSKFTSLNITVSGYNKTGTYPFNGATSGLYIAKDGGYLAHYIVYTGDTTSVINVTQDGSAWEGSFNFRAVRQDQGQPNDTVTITGGYFNIPK